MKKNKYHDPKQTTDAEVVEHMAKMISKEYDIDLVEATKRVHNLITSGLVFRFEEGSEQGAIFTDHFLMIPSDVYEKLSNPSLR